MIAAPEDLARALLTILFGALAGGVTNRVAVWMLFHPYEPPELLGRRVGWLQGALPKNQGRLARRIGETVGTRLLTPADVAEELQDEALRASFEDRLRQLLLDLAEGEHPPPAELLPPRALAEVRGVLRRGLDELYGALPEILASPGFREEAEGVLADLRSSLADEPIGEALEPARVADLRERLGGWLAELAASPAFERTVRRQIGKAAEHVLRPGRSLEDVIPTGVVAALEHAINDYLPVAMERLGRLLEDEEARHRVEGTVRELLDRFMRDLRFHQRVVARLIITEDTVDRVIRTIEAEGAEQLASLLREDEVQDAMARSVNEAIVEFLRRPTTRVLGRAEDPQVASAVDAVSERIVSAARDPGGRRFLLEQLEEGLARFGERSWAEVADLVPAERVGPWLAAALRSEPGRAMFDRVAEAGLDRLLEHPIGRLGILREDGAERLADALAPPAWRWITDQVPAVTERIHVAERVEEKIRDYPLQELESLVRRVTQHELDLIVQLGYVLGAVIGTGLVVIGALLP